MFLLLDDFDDYLVDYDTWLGDVAKADIADSHFDREYGISYKQGDRKRVCENVVGNYAEQTSFLLYVARL